MISLAKYWAEILHAKSIHETAHQIAHMPPMPGIPPPCFYISIYIFIMNLVMASDTSLSPVCMKPMIDSSSWSFVTPSLRKSASSTFAYSTNISIIISISSPPPAAACFCMVACFLICSICIAYAVSKACSVFWRERPPGFSAFGGVGFSEGSLPYCAAISI